VSQSSEFCLHKPLCRFSYSNTKDKLTFRYRLSTETFGYSLVYRLNEWEYFVPTYPIKVSGCLSHQTISNGAKVTRLSTSRHSIIPINIMYLELLNKEAERDIKYISIGLIVPMKSDNDFQFFTSLEDTYNVWYYSQLLKCKWINKLRSQWLLICFKTYISISTTALTWSINDWDGSNRTVSVRIFFIRLEMRNFLSASSLTRMSKCVFFYRKWMINCRNLTYVGQKYWLRHCM
jgi:hypothetical protein